MAGIGFALRKLTRRDDLLGIVQGYGHSALTAAGPWLITIVSLSTLVFFGSSVVSVEDLNTFRLIVIYNFSFSLVLAGPGVMVVTRFLADSIYAKDVSGAPSALIGSMMFLFALQAIVAIPYYFFYVDLDNIARAAAVVNFFIVGGIWIVSVFLTALKDYNFITAVFGIGMFSGLASSWLLAPGAGVVGLLLGFSSGLALILFALVGKVLAEYPYAVKKPRMLRAGFRKYWQLAASGLVYNAAIWIDKWIMWTSPEARTLRSGMVSYPDYDSAMFLAYLTIVPTMAAFVLAIETDFFEQYVRFYQDIQKHATYSQIAANHGRLIESILRGARNFLVLQSSMCVGAIFLGPAIFEFFNISFAQLPMFRIGALGALFHVMFLAASIVISYFDMRGTTLALQVLFLVSNGVFTYLSMRMGFAYYGYGYFLASLLAFMASFLAIARFVNDLPYQTFVANNSSVN